ncbi:hypothetical protein [Lacimicrobium alkaliphilum]|uniref:Uncharacterized protein n=1 Tax=Lacimicrobium alkaliphilum TaxID=1526571 RepID=A0A0U2QJH5_9ALTE|nr:hypothetical protein [Lacimicrobium alkaliphilum]ALS97211.1 hypothetical protein AT746_02230 [Lacimicrobium alkaliphilum]
MYEKKRYKAALTLIVVILLNGCQALSPQVNAPVDDVGNEPLEKLKVKKSSSARVKQDFGEYYLWLKEQPVGVLEQEVQTRRDGKQQGDVADMLKLVLLYSLPNSPVRNPHQARTELLRLFNQQEVAIPGTFYALFDQLTDNIKRQRQLLETSESLDHILQEKQSLEQQLQQLKLIEQNILKREVENNGS